MSRAESFDAMRASLVERGLLSADFKLTPAGHAHADVLIAELAVAEDDGAPGKTAVRWNTGRRA